MDLSELRVELEKLHPASFGWAMSCCGRNRADAEEVLQSVYLKILQGKARYRNEANLRTFVFAVIRKTAISERRKQLLRNLKIILAEQATIVSDQPSRVSNQPEADYERSEMQQRFQLALARLPARQQETLHLVFYQDLSLSEAAEVMNISVGSARRHYERGKKRLREMLEREGVEYGLSWKRKRIQALFSELLLEDQRAAPRFEEVCQRARLIGPTPIHRFGSSPVLIAVTLFVVAGLSLGAWSWYRSNRASTSNAAELLPPEISKPTSLPVQVVVAESKDRKFAAPGMKSSVKHRRNVARLRPSEHAAIRDAALLARWQSPTQIFMSSPAAVGLNSLPQLNQSVEELKRFLPENTELKKEPNR